MSSVAEIESAIARLPVQAAEDQREMTPEILDSIERGKADLVERRTRIGRP